MTLAVPAISDPLALAAPTSGTKAASNCNSPSALRSKERYLLWGFPLPGRPSCPWPLLLEVWWPRLHSFAVGLEGSPDLAAAQAVEHVGLPEAQLNLMNSRAVDLVERGVVRILPEFEPGHVLFSTRDPDRHREEIQARMGVCFEEKNLYDAMSGEENLRFFAQLYNLPEAEARISALLDRVGLAARRGRGGAARAVAPPLRPLSSPSQARQGAAGPGGALPPRQRGVALRDRERRQHRDLGGHQRPGGPFGIRLQTLNVATIFDRQQRQDRIDTLSGQLLQQVDAPGRYHLGADRTCRRLETNLFFWWIRTSSTAGSPENSP